MRTLHYDGVAAVTDDDIADAVLGLAIAVARYGQYELVSIPVIAQGRIEELTFMLGPTIHLSALTTERLAGDPDLEDAVAVAEGIRRRAEELDDPLRPLGRDLPVWLEARP
jgi:hypothetical protein